MNMSQAEDDILGDHSTQSSDLKVDKHVEYYFNDIVFLVENQLFKVPRRNFAVESEVFSDMFQLPAPVKDGCALDGSSDDQPLRLEGIKKSEFLQLLRVMFPSDSQQPDLLTAGEWTSVLKLSNMWQFHKIRATAIKKMEDLSMDLVDKIVVARRFDISAWLVPTLNALIQREKPIDFSEGTRLGMEWTLKVAEIRESDARDASQERTCTHCSYKGPARCNSCNDTAANRCCSCDNYLAIAATSTNTGKRGERSSVDYSTSIREVFGLCDVVCDARSDRGR
jgi:hypothetical protein